MCLTCIHFRNKNIVVQPEIKKVFDLSQSLGFDDLTLADFKDIPGSLTGNYLHTHDNKILELTDKQIKEINENSVAIVLTGVDTRVDVWGIQWLNDYKPISF